MSFEPDQRLSNVIEEIDTEINQFDWYLFPHEIQKVLPIVISNAQEESVIKCFGNVSCSREQFNKVSLFKNFTLSDRNKKVSTEQ